MNCEKCKHYVSKDANRGFCVLSPPQFVERGVWLQPTVACTQRCSQHEPVAKAGSPSQTGTPSQNGGNPNKVSTGWVIENGRSPVHSPEYFVGGTPSVRGGSCWSPHSLEAVRFARAEDAKAMHDYAFLSNSGHRICEHHWSD